jgi:DNA-binding NarL/FixJ family response regulator
MTTAKRIRVLIVDDHEMVRDSLKSVLGGYPNLEIVGEAGDGEAAIQMVTKLQPSLVIMDINLPKMDGITATRYIKTHHPDVAVVGLSLIVQSYSEDAMKRAGAFEVVDKEKIMHELYGAMQRAVASIQPVLILEDVPATDNSSVASSSADTSIEKLDSPLANDERR